MIKRVTRAWVTITVTILLVSVLALLYVGRVLETFRRPAMRAWSQVQVGDHEAVVRSLLGAPHREYSAKGAPRDYYVPGYARRVRPIRGGVLIYTGSDLVMYIWIDDDGRVEDIFIGSS